MAEKLSIAYVGPKKEKRMYDHEKKIDLIFPQFVPVEVDEATAYRFLKFEGVFSRSSDLKDAKADLEAAEKARAKKEKEEQAERERLEKENNMTVTLGEGEVVDLNKLTKPKLATLVEREGIEVPDHGEKVGDYKAAVKAALVAKYPQP